MIERALPAGRTQQISISFISATRDRDTEPVVQPCWNLAGNGRIQAADEHGSDGANVWIEACVDAPLDAPQIRFSRRKVLFARKQERHIDRHAGKNRFLDGRQSFGCSWNLDEEVWPASPGGQLPGGCEG